MTTIRAAHLLDDTAFGGVTRALAVFANPRLAARIDSRVHQVDPHALCAPRLDARMIVIHATPRWRALPWLVALRLRNPGARIVHVEHSYTPAWAALHVRRPGRFAAMLRAWYALCDDVVAVSHGQAQWLCRFIGARRLLRVIAPWSGEQNLGHVPPLEPCGERPLRLAAFGRFAEQKGFDTLVQAMRLLPRDRFTLTLGGFGPDEALLRGLADGGPVRFSGRVDDVAGFLAEADLVVVPSRWEAFGQVVTETMLAGRPVLVAAVDGMPEQVTGRQWIADCSTPESLARAIRAIDRDALVAAGRANRAAMAGAEAGRIGGWLSLAEALAA
jgi:glycosyltransferase involved in cell wall biosynthesis